MSENRLPALQRKPLSATVLDHLREAIHDGQFMPGERLVEQSLAQEFDVSRGPVRDALRELEHEGLVISEPNRGTYVARLKRKDLEEIYSLRMALDLLAVELACRQADEAHHGELRAIIEKMRKAVSDGLSGRDAVELDLQFHDAIYRATGHERLYFFWQTLRPQVKTLLLERVTELADFTDVLIPFHQSLLEVICARDQRQALELMKTHVRNAYQPLARSLEDNHPPGEE
jgi:DNA-binding GntR family transcriptional regulator